MKQNETMSVRSLHATLYPLEERKRRNWLAIRFLLFLWIGVTIYNCIAVVPHIEPITRRIILAGTVGFLGPVLDVLASMQIFRFISDAHLAIISAVGLLLLILRMAFPPKTVRSVLDERAHAHALSQGRLHPDMVARQMYLTKPGIPMVRVGRRTIGLPCGADVGHVAVVAPTRSGKGLHLSHTALSWPGAMIIIDPKGEQWKRTAAWREAHVGPVFRMPSCGIDVLDYFQPQSDLDVQELYQHLMRPSQDKDPVFSQKTFDLFIAAMQVGRARDTHPLHILGYWATLPASQALQDAASIAPEAINRFTDGDSPLRPNRFTLTSWGIFTTRMSPLLPHLSLLTTPTVPKDWAFRRATIYVCYPLETMQGAGPLISTVLASLIRGQMAQATRQPMLVAIDELPALRLPQLATYLATVGGSGITMLFYIQAMTQLIDVYGDAGAEAILGNCHHQLYYPPRDMVTARHMSEVFGTMMTTSETVHRGRQGSQGGLHEVVRDALEPAQMLALPEEAVLTLTQQGNRQYRFIGHRLDPRSVLSVVAPVNERT